LPPGFSWKNQQIGVYFWRQGDAGYFFNTKVIDDFFDKKYPIIHIAHTSNLIRSQKRQSVRVEVGKNALLFPLRSTQEANEEVEVSQGLRCKLLDISEDGASVLIGGRAKVGLPVKLQFVLTEPTIVINCIVKGVNYDNSKNRSILHLQTLPISKNTRNQILIYVYNIFQDREDTVAKTPKIE